MGSKPLRISSKTFLLTKPVSSGTSLYWSPRGPCSAVLDVDRTNVRLADGQRRVPGRSGIFAEMPRIKSQT